LLGALVVHTGEHVGWVEFKNFCDAQAHFIVEGVAECSVFTHVLALYSEVDGQSAV
jgi:hypothetical protein